MNDEDWLAKIREDSNDLAVRRGYADWLERFCALAGLDRVSLVMHDWGAVGLAFAQRAPERV